MLPHLSRRLLVATLNHLLGQAPWARHKTRELAGRPVHIDAFPIRATLIFDAEGWVSLSDQPAEASLSITPLALLRMAASDSSADRSVEVSGDAQLAARFGIILRNLTWDAEADLAGLVGDVAARALVSASQSLIAWHNLSLIQQARNWIEYSTEEVALLAKRSDINAFIAEVDELRDHLARLEKRVALLHPGEANASQ